MKRIAMIVEGNTEKVFLSHLIKFLEAQFKKSKTPMPKLIPSVHHGRIPTGVELKGEVQRLLSGKNPSDYVIALTDVYTGSHPPVFKNAEDAKSKMRDWVGDEPRFYPHVALHEFAAWLLPFWPYIQELANHNMRLPNRNPETINHNNPPSHWLKEIFRNGTRRKKYFKRRDADNILRRNDLSNAIAACPELKSLVNTIISLCGGVAIP